MADGERGVLMSRIEVKGDRELDALGAAIVAAWYRALPETAGPAVGDVADSLPQIREVCRQLFAVGVTINVMADARDGTLVNLVIPQVPDTVRSREDLASYLAEYNFRSQGSRFHEDLGKAVIFGCGK